MPFKSKAQEGYMHIHHPDIAKRWDKITNNPKALPEHVKQKEHSSIMEEAFKRAKETYSKK